MEHEECLTDSIDVRLEHGRGCLSSARGAGQGQFLYWHSTIAHKVCTLAVDFLKKEREDQKSLWLYVRCYSCYVAYIYLVCASVVHAFAVVGHARYSSVVIFDGC